MRWGTFANGGTIQAVLNCGPGLYHDVMPLAATEFDVFTVLAWSAGLIVLLLVGMAFALRLKRRMKQDDDDATVPAAGFTLSDLRAMHRAGQLTEEEFNKAKEKIVVAAQRAAERIPATGNPEKDSVAAIRARRATREQEHGNQDPPPDAPGAA